MNVPLLRLSQNKNINKLTTYIKLHTVFHFLIIKNNINMAAMRIYYLGIKLLPLKIHDTGYNFRDIITIRNV